MRVVRWTNIDAQAWVHRLAVLTTIVWSVLTILAVVAAAAAEVLLFALLPAGVAALSGWMTAAWRRGQSWSWWAWAVVSGVDGALSLGGLLTSGSTPSGVLQLGVSAAVLVLLCHPDCRARIHGSVPVLPTPGRSAAAIEDLYR